MGMSAGERMRCWMDWMICSVARASCNAKWLNRVVVRKIALVDPGVGLFSMNENGVINNLLCE